jgi:hypothetical protein
VVGLFLETFFVMCWSFQETLSAAEAWEGLRSKVLELTGTENPFFKYIQMVKKKYAALCKTFK